MNNKHTHTQREREREREREVNDNNSHSRKLCTSSQPTRCEDGGPDNIVKSKHCGTPYSKDPGTTVKRDVPERRKMIRSPLSKMMRMPCFLATSPLVESVYAKLSQCLIPRPEATCNAIAVIITKTKENHGK